MWHGTVHEPPTPSTSHMAGRWTDQKAKEYGDRALGYALDLRKSTEDYFCFVVLKLGHATMKRGQRFLVPRQKSRDSLANQVGDAAKKPILVESNGSSDDDEDHGLLAR